MRLEERGEHEQAPDAVDDARNAGEQLNGDADRPPQVFRTDFSEEDGDAEADGNADQHGDEGGHDCAVDRRQGPEFLGDRVPALRGEEIEAESAPGGQRANHKRDHHACEDHQHGDGRSLRQDVEGAVADAKAAQDPGALLVIPDPDLNGHGLKRHVHPLGPFCRNVANQVENRGRSGRWLPLPRSRRPLVHRENGLSGGVLDLCPLPAGEFNNVGGHRDVIELFGHLSAVLIRPVEEFEC